MMSRASLEQCSVMLSNAQQCSAILRNAQQCSGILVLSPNDEQKAQTFKELEKKDQGQFCQILVCKTTMTPLGVIS